MYQYFKRQLKTLTCSRSFGIHPQGVLNVLHWNYLWCFVCVVGVWQRKIWTVIWNGMWDLYSIVPKLLTCPDPLHQLLSILVILELYRTNLTFRFILQSKFYAAKHRLRTQNITSNFSEACLIFPEDGSERIRSMSEFLVVFKILIHVDFNFWSFIQLSALVGK